MPTRFRVETAALAQAQQRLGDGPSAVLDVQTILLTMVTSVDSVGGRLPAAVRRFAEQWTNELNDDQAILAGLYNTLNAARRDYEATDDVAVRFKGQ